MFLADMTCCVCREKRKPVQIHHIDEDPAHDEMDNLAVLCLDCHHDTQVKGGFNRKLNAPLVKKYRADWLEAVAATRSGSSESVRHQNSDQLRAIQYTQLAEESDEYSYDFLANYIQIQTSNPATDAEVNLCISAFITQQLQRFRMGAVERMSWKREISEGINIGPEPKAGIMTMEHEVSLFTPEILAVRFKMFRYNAGANHPNTWNNVLNFRLSPCLQLEPEFLFEFPVKYEEKLSELCIPELRRKVEETRRSHGVLGEYDYSHIERGAGPDEKNFRNILLRQYGITVIFDTFQVGAYTSGEFEVFIPSYKLKGLLRSDIAERLT